MTASIGRRASDLEDAVRQHHGEIRHHLEAFADDWRYGDVCIARGRFGALARMICGHFDWEQRQLVDPVRGRLAVYDNQMLQRDGDAHREIRAALTRLGARICASAKADQTGVEALTCRVVELLEAHRTIFETQLRSRLCELLSESSESAAAASLRSLRD